MPAPEAIKLDAVILGGGIAGLWTLDELARAGLACVLIEAGALGAGQTIASQGIIHGGLKYSLDELWRPAAEAIREMPGVWRDCIAGRREPNLSRARCRADHCHLWRTDSLTSRLGMIGARVGLRVAPQVIEDSQRPAALKGCPGTVARLDEPVIDPAGVLAALASRHEERLLKTDWPGGMRLHMSVAQPGAVDRVTLVDEARSRAVELFPRITVLAAGAGNEALREAAGLPRHAMQRRPLHMVMIRSEGRSLPALNGHCVDGARTRATITTACDSAGRAIWQVGGQIAEDGVRMDSTALVAHARRELRAVLPGIEFDGVEWSTQCVDRAEAATSTGARPDDAYAVREGNIITAWPTKLALAPALAVRVARLVAEAAGPPPARAAVSIDWARPIVARPPWEEPRTWIPAASAARA